jgi:lipoprotein-anchoring transpeptidase ErfK/SrfK
VRGPGTGRHPGPPADRRRWSRAVAAAAVVVAAALIGVLVAPGTRSSVASRTSAVSPDAPNPAVDAAGLAPPAPGFAIPQPRPLAATRDVTRWAPVIEATDAHRRPDAYSPVVARVGTSTPEGTANLVDADAEVERGGSAWVRARLSALPDGTVGWLPRAALGGWSFVDTRVVIDRRALTLTLYRNGGRVFRAPVGIGAPGTPTPTGQFYVRDRLTRYASPQYGPIAFGTSARSATETDWPAGGFIGIHGTDQPALIPGRISHGCIRLRNAAILALARLMPVGTPVMIQ